MTGASPTLAHVGAAAWPAVAVGGALFVGVCARGALVPAPSATSVRRLVALVAATAAGVAGLSPWVERAAQERFSVHMAQHLLLISLAAPLVVVARPSRLIGRAVGANSAERATRAPARALRRHVSPAAQCATATVVSVATVWVWHVAPLYDGAVTSDPLHAIEHLTLIAAAWWFWHAVLRGRTPAHVALGALLVAAVAHALLGAVLTFSTRPVYRSYVDNGLEDQQLAGLLMWVPGGLVHLVVAAVVVVAWIERSTRRTRLRERLVG